MTTSKIFKGLVMTPNPAGQSLGEFVISFDMELGWGSIENGQWSILQDTGVFERTRPAVQRLLEALDDFEIQATWGVVGCAIIPAEERDWDHLPAAVRDSIASAVSIAKHETFDGRDLLEAVASRRVGHAFCSHTYSHFRLTHPLATRSAALEELRRFRACFPRELALRDRLIFPRNAEAFLDEVREAGIATIRGTDRDLRNTWRGRVRRFLADCSSPAASRRELVGAGLWRETDSLIFHTSRRPWRMRRLRRRAAHALTMLAHRRQTFHIWLHPFDLGAEPGLLECLVDHLRLVARLRDEGKLIVRLF
ncbi:MAG TPA: hypothetical protein VIY86_03120 [Pirellulaceae bacterium]